MKTWMARMSALCLGLAGCLAGMAPTNAVQLNEPAATGGVGPDSESIKRYPSALTIRYAVAGANLQIAANDAPLSVIGGAAPGMFTPNMPVATTGIHFRALGNRCTFANAAATVTSCPLGTLRLSFSRPVTNPVLHVVAFGNVRTGGNAITAARPVHTITSSTPAGATMTLLAGSVNLQTPGGGTSLDLVDTRFNGTNCSTVTAPATQPAGCGSVRINGTVSSVTFDVGMTGTRSEASFLVGEALGDDDYVVTVTVDEDFGDAPATYDAGEAASHVLGGLRFGATADADNIAVFNTAPAVTPGPNAVAAGADNNGVAADGADEDGLTAPLPTLHVGMIGQTYTLSPVLSGVTAAANVCGWIDFNRNNVFDTAEGTCTAAASGATSAPLSWAVPTATTSGRTYVRLRASYAALDAALPTGRVDSGEVEDYMIEVKPAVRVTKHLDPVSDPGQFALSIGGTVFAAATGHDGTTNFRTLYHNSASGMPDLAVEQNIQANAIATIVSEAPTPATTGTYNSTYRCVNGSGATIASGTGTSANVTLPASVTGAAANGRAQAVTCTYVNALLAMTVTKTTPQTSISAPGTIHYSIVVTNTGAAPLTGVNLVDTLPNGTAGAVTFASGDANANGVLDAGEAWTYVTSYAATQANVDAGTNLVNNVSVTATQINTPVTASATTTVVQSPSMTVEKTTPTNAIGVPMTIAYSIVVTNTGNITLSGVTPVDTLPDGTNGALQRVSGDANANGMLDVGEAWTYAARYVATQADVKAGDVLVNHVSVTTRQIATPVASSAATAITHGPALSVNKTTPTAHIAVPGAIAYAITVTNTGNIALTDVTPVDSLPDGAAGAVTFVSGDTDGDNQLDLGETWMYSASYIARQADIDAGAPLVNTVSVTSAQTARPVTSHATTTIVQKPDMSVTKSTTMTMISAPSTIPYIVVVTNTGNVALTGVTPVDTLPNGTNGTLTPVSGDGNTNGVLDVGEAWSYIASYAATEADIDARRPLVNAVSVTAKQIAIPVTATATTAVVARPPAAPVPVFGRLAWLVFVAGAALVALAMMRRSSAPPCTGRQ